MAFTVRQAALMALQAARGIAPSAAFGLHTNALTITVRTWASGKLGQPNAGGPPDYTDASTAITPIPHMHQISLSEVASSGGAFREGDIRVGPITPYDAFANPAGYTVAQLRPVPPPGSRGVEILYVITGPLAGVYALVELTGDRPLRHELVLRRTERAP